MQPVCQQTPKPAYTPSRLSRLLALARYHRPSQFALRALSVLRRKLPFDKPPELKQLPAGAGLRDFPGFRSLLSAKTAHPDALSSDLAADALGGVFTFLNERHELGRPVDWRCESVPVSHLWRFHLHYHEFFLGLLTSSDALCGCENPIADAWEMVADWIANNRPTEPGVRTDAWHPFCISKRLPVWMLLWTVSPPEKSRRDAVLASMFAQARFLSSHLETDLGGNHLLEDLRALILAGAFFEGPEAEAWLDRGIGLFRREADEQFLSHGEHFERSPMYHAIMLELLLDLRDALGKLRGEFAEWCAELAGRMGRFLQAIRHPDGEIPLLGDSAFGESLPTPAILARVGDTSDSPPANGAATVGDYWTFRAGDDFLLFDRGPVGADHLPAHAHADLLGFEASFGGRRVFVDAGVYNYEDDSLRAYCRGSAAHNVLTVDDVDQCDIWSKFRMGYRGKPVDVQNGRSGDFEWAFAGHDAYRRLGVPRVDRFIACRADGPWFFVDSVPSGSEHAFVSRLHFHPDVKPVPLSEQAVEFELAGRSYVLQCAGTPSIEIEESWYCPRFGEKQPAHAVIARRNGIPPISMAWCLSTKETQAAVSWSSLDSILYKDSRHAFKIDLPSRNIVDVTSPENT